MAVMALAGCSESYLTVPVKIAPRNIPDFAAAENLFYIDFIADVPQPGFDPLPKLNTFFTSELAPYIGKKISYLDVPHWSLIRRLLKQLNLIQAFQYDNNMFFKNVYDAHPRSLFFTGKLTVDIKERSIIKDIHNEVGKKTSQFVKVGFWEMNLHIAIIDGSAMKIVFENTYIEKKESEEMAAAAIFASLLNSFKDHFINQIFRPAEFQERFILKK